MSKDQEKDNPKNNTPDELEPPATDDKSSASTAETKQMGHSTKPTNPYQVSEAGGPLPELDEGPASGCC